MTHLLVEGVYWFLQDSPLENIAQYPSSLQPLILSQESIGWDQFFLGRISALWSTTHLESLNQRGKAITKYNSGVHWSASLIKIIWGHIHQVWIHRNTICHGITLAEQQEKQRQQCVSELSLYYSYYIKKLLPPDFPSHIFYSTIQEHLHRESTLHDLDNWLSTYRDYILDSKQRHSLLAPTVGAPSVVSNQRGLNRSSGVGIILE